MKYIWVKAEVFLFDKNTGGIAERKIRTSFHPNLVFNFKKSLYTLYDKSKGKYIISSVCDDNLLFKDGLFFIDDTICSGEVRTCVIRLVTPLTKKYYKPQKDFLLREGSWVVGMGKMIEKTKPELFEFISEKYHN